MRKLLIAATALGLGVGTVLGIPAAHAETLPASCIADGHVLNGTADYVPQGLAHRWTTATYWISGSGTGGESNVNLSIRERDASGNDTFVFRDFSEDNIKQNRHYTVSLNNTLTRSYLREFVTFRGIFDTSGYDERCNAYTARI